MIAHVVNSPSQEEEDSNSARLGKRLRISDTQDPKENLAPNVLLTSHPPAHDGCGTQMPQQGACNLLETGVVSIIFEIEVDQVGHISFEHGREM
ncbi:hypothetical protein C5167_041009 [Papaver somniferum]|uniref:Uncharacterized protein n=1 Tax=Papaver somniferum TaxID=3469 RepID=A0A4Y7IK24_PAPSO|nr:hypothetical protein C5167_041009 [Papaver somniferum]